jgi:putative drug exporter of the RND superfamily
VVASAPQLTSTTDQSAFLPSHYESIQAMELQEKAFPQNQAPAALLVFVRSDSAPLSEEDSAGVAAIAGKLRRAVVPDGLGIPWIRCDTGRFGAGIPEPSGKFRLGNSERAAFRSCRC